MTDPTPHSHQFPLEYDMSLSGMLKHTREDATRQAAARIDAAWERDQ